MSRSTNRRPGDHVGMGSGNRMKQVVSVVPAQRPYARHRLRLLGLMLTLAPFAMIGEAQAACVQTGSDVSCTGNSASFGTGVENGITITVQDGATVTSLVGGAINVNTATVNNRATVSSPNSVAIIANDSITVANSTAIAHITGHFSAVSATNTVTITANAGFIEADAANGNAIIAATVNVLANAGQIKSTGVSSSAIQATGIATVANNTSGLISGTLFGIEGHAVVLTGNAGTIEATATGAAILANTSANVTNSSGGHIQALGAGGRAIQADTAIIANAGFISADATGITASSINVSANTGTIEAINANGVGISANTVNVNSAAAGVIRANGTNGKAISATDLTAVNSGTVEATGSGGRAIVASTFSITNSGLISASSSGISGSGTVNNTSGIIEATGASGRAISARTGNVENGSSGIIRATGATSVGIFSAEAITIVNAGTISGVTGIQANGATNVGTVITNSGTVTGTGGTAIKLSAAADTLTLLPGSHIVGVVDMGGNNGDVINAFAAIPTSRVSSLTTAPALPTIINFTGTLHSGFVGAATGPSVQSTTQVASVDPTALAQTDRTLMDFTGGASSLVRGRLNGSGNNGMIAVGPAADCAKTGAHTKAPSGDLLNPAPITVWVNSFGGRRIQDETSSILGSTSNAWGVAMGVDRKLQPNWLIGAFIGGGSGSLSVDLNSQTVNTDYVFGGGYSR